MKNAEFMEGTMIKGKELKEHILCKVLSENMVMQGFQYRMGMNEDIKPLAMSGSCGAGLHFCLIKDICGYLYYGSRLALVGIPDGEDVYVDDGKFRTHRLEIKKLLPLDKLTAWKYLYENGADITAHNNDAVMRAAENGHLEVVKYLHEHGADIMAGNNSALRGAARWGHSEVVKYLHEHGAEIIAGDNDALRCAAEYGHLEVVKYLYEHGADLTARDNYAVRYAAKNGHLKVVKYLHKHGADLTADDDYAIRYAAERGYFDVVEYLEENM